MKFNIAYFGPEPLFHLRRDFLLAMKFGLESLGHDAVLSGLALEGDRFNLIVGAYFLPPAEIKKIAGFNVPHAHVNTEVIAQDMLNFNPQKTDFLGAYLPAMQAGKFVWDVIMDNMAEHQRYGSTAHFLRWGWHPKLEDIEHRQPKDLDYYFFGLMSQRRLGIIKSIQAKGLRGAADGSCPYFLRNDRIARAKVQLNIIQEDKYTHVNSFRICYLANNRCAILSERETDPANYLSLAQIADREHIAEAVADLVTGDKWRALGERAYADFRKVPMQTCLEELLDKSFTKAMV
jgi:hypothetical protein